MLRNENKIRIEGQIVMLMVQLFLLDNVWIITVIVVKSIDLNCKYEQSTTVFLAVGEKL